MTMKNNTFNTQYFYPESWIIGFSEGEITFGLSITGNKIKCQPIGCLPQDEKDLNVLNNIKQQFNCGAIMYIMGIQGIEKFGILK